tara:strand:+ start:55 stop:2160 length:2106 start_codon:yes stop_codon:yes gene_type:complete
MIKCTSQSQDWVVYHRGSHPDPEYHALRLNDSSAVFSDAAFNNTLPTSTNFSLGTGGLTNGNGETYVAYVFAGGESPAALARSVEFSGTGQTLSLGSSSDFDFGTGDFTIECWGYRESGQAWTCFDHLMGSDNFIIFSYANQDIRIYAAQGGGHVVSGVNPGNERWFHLAVVRESGELRFYIDGVLAATHNFTLDITQAGVVIGAAQSGLQCRGLVSNLRVVKGTAVYTSSFRPPTEPLTNITNTVLLCCNNSSTTGSTVTPGTITANGSVSASTNSPFDDPAGFKFGENEDQNLIKCGSYVGTGSAGVKVNIGWEPQLILVKSTASGENWEIYDSMRGIVDGLDDRRLRVNTTAAEDDNPGFFSLRSDGFIIDGTSGSVNTNNTTYVYMVIRRADGYVGKPVEAGSEVFSMDTGGNGTFPEYDSTHPVDMGFLRTAAGASNTYLSTRIAGLTELVVNTDAKETSQVKMVFDHMAGYIDYGFGSSTQAWMWKRHKGFDCICYKGDGVGKNLGGNQIPHSLSKTPEMMWVKRRDVTTANWAVYHKGANSGTNPEQYMFKLNSSAAENVNSSEFWADTAPTSTHFIVGNTNAVNNSNSNYLAILFATTDVSKVGYYTGTGSSHTITTGFQPRFILFKQSNDTGSWKYYDTLRTTSSPFTKQIFLNLTDGPDTVSFLSVSSTGFTLSDTNNNGSGEKWLYYAHA